MLLNPLIHKKIGIWGFGVTGQSILRYLAQTPCTISIFEQKELSPELLTLASQYGARVWQTPNPTEFLENQDFVIPSPGINRTPVKLLPSSIFLIRHALQKQLP